MSRTGDDQLHLQGDTDDSSAALGLLETTYFNPIAFGRGGIQSLLILAQYKTYRNRQKIIDKYVKMIKFLADNMVYYIIG